MSEHLLKIAGVHYGANGDSVAGQKDTEEMHARTRELLSWIETERPIVVLSPDPKNHIHKNAIQARAMGRRIGRVAFECVDLAWTLMRQSGQPMMLACVKEVDIREHGYLTVAVEAKDSLSDMPTATTEIEWKEWLSDMPLLPPSELLQAELEVAYVIDNVFMPDLSKTNIAELKKYLEIWMEGSRHDLSREARQKGSYYIEQLEATADKDIRQLAEPLKEQRRRICERTFLDEHATEWWQERLKSSDMQQLWLQWKLKNENKLWLGLRRIDAMLRELPGELYSDIGQLDVMLSRLYYMNTPRKAFQAILAMMMLRELTCRELGIDMRAMTDDEYGQDGRITNPLDMPTTIGRVVAFGETHCDSTQKQTIELLAHWLRDDYQQMHCPEIEALGGDGQSRLVRALETVASKPVNEFNVYPQTGSTANLGCDQKSSDFKTYLPGADCVGQQSMLESKKGEEK